MLVGNNRIALLKASSTRILSNLIHICIHSLIIAASAIQKIRHEAEMGNIARGEAECSISIEAECQVLYFMYSTWQGNDLNVIKNFLAIIIHIPIVPSILIHHIKSGQTHCL